MDNLPDKLDQFFANKLRREEVTPSAAAWERLRARQPEPKRRAGFWPYAVAASVALLLAGTWVAVQRSLGTSRNGPRFVQLSPAQPQAARQQPATTPPNRQLPTTRPPDPAQSTNLARDSRAPAPSKTTAHSGNKPEKKPGHRQPAQPANQLTHQPIPRFKPTENEIVIVQSGEHTTLPQPGVLPIAPPTASPTPTTVVLNIADEPTDAATPDENVEEVADVLAKADRKRTKAGRVLAQVKNFAVGKDVDWRELELRPAALLASLKNKKSAN